MTMQRFAPTLVLLTLVTFSAALTVKEQATAALGVDADAWMTESESELVGTPRPRVLHTMRASSKFSTQVLKLLGQADPEAGVEMVTYKVPLTAEIAHSDTADSNTSQVVIEFTITVPANQSVAEIEKKLNDLDPAEFLAILKAELTKAGSPYADKIKGVTVGEPESSEAWASDEVVTDEVVTDGSTTEEPHVPAVPVSSTAKPSTTRDDLQESAAKSCMAAGAVFLVSSLHIAMSAM